MYRVQRLQLRTGREAATVVDERYSPVEPVHRWVRHLVARDRSPRTIEAYAFGVRYLLEYCALVRCEWDRLTLDDLAGFMLQVA